MSVQDMLSIREEKKTTVGCRRKQFKRFIRLLTHPGVLTTIAISAYLLFALFRLAEYEIKKIAIDNIMMSDYTEEISANRMYSTIKQLSATDDARTTGSNGEKRAAKFIAAKFKELGLEVREQQFSIEVPFIKAYARTIAEANATAGGMARRRTYGQEYYLKCVSQNIIATYKPEDLKNSEDCVVIGAHYDGVNTPAANDNASGVAMMLEAARLIIGQAPDCEIRFIAFGAEETGTDGSRFYVSSLSDKQKGNILCMLNFDMVGIGSIMEVHTGQRPKRSPLIYLSQKTMNWFNYKNSTSRLDRSDHESFEAFDIPCAFFDYGPCDTNHTDTDTIEHISKENLLRSCNVAVNVCKVVTEKPWLFKR